MSDEYEKKIGIPDHHTLKQYQWNGKDKEKAKTLMYTFLMK